MTGPDEPGAADAASGRHTEPDATPRVVAVTVTYRRPDLLARCIEAVRSQTRPPDHHLIVDNAGTTAEAEPGRGLEIVETGENLGPAGGYALGFGMALERGADKVWAVDDDVEPQPDCLERLLAASEGSDVVVPAQVREGTPAHRRTWNGPLIDAGVIRRAGVPRADFFFRAEDTEWYRRAETEGFPIRDAPDAVVLDRAPARVPGAERVDWRQYYDVRNRLYFNLRVERPTAAIVLDHAWRYGIRRPLKILLTHPDRARAMRLWWWGVRDFARGRLGRRVDPGTWDR